MGVRADIREEVRKETVTKIHGQPTNHDLTILEKELITILTNILMTLGGGNHGHAGILFALLLRALLIAPPRQCLLHRRCLFLVGCCILRSYSGHLRPHQIFIILFFVT